MIHIVSPVLYMLFVESFRFIKPCPSNRCMILCRKFHNINLSVLSLLMFKGITYANYRQDKLSTIDGILCKSYNRDIYAEIWTNLFLYSKYLEWLDTLFLHLSGHKISGLQYTHHMSTALLTYSYIYDDINPQTFLPMSINCLVHVFMYWYFAYPRGVLKQFKKIITKTQIVQHMICVSIPFYTYFKRDCKQNMYSNEATVILYTMYLVYFAKFYMDSYHNRKNKQYILKE